MLNSLESVNIYIYIYIYIYICVCVCVCVCLQYKNCSLHRPTLLDRGIETSRLSVNAPFL